MFIGEGPGETEDQTGRLLCLRESFLNDYYEIIQKRHVIGAVQLRTVQQDAKTPIVFKTVGVFNILFIC